ncbi:MAG: NTP transferase domain-containing protein [Candidatus Parcubacteria bacterium]|nr:NTP transferase domain-containing protein [Candidatus Parcubacteria bacterium]
MYKVKIIILAAGQGTRMASEEPKALAMLKGKPFIQHILDTIKKLDPSIKPILVVGHKKERIKEILGEKYNYVEQKEQLGTGHAVMSARKAIEGEHENILVLYTDQPLVSETTLKRIIEKHIEKKPTITLATVVIDDFEDWRIKLNHYGRIIRGTDGLVKSIVEFKDATDAEKKIRELNPAFYVFDAKWLWENIDKLKNENSKKEFYLTEIVKMAFEQNKRIETVPVAGIIEALQPNSKEELDILEKLIF